MVFSEVHPDHYQICNEGFLNSLHTHPSFKLPFMAPALFNSKQRIFFMHKRDNSTSLLKSLSCLLQKEQNFKLFERLCIVFLKIACLSSLHSIYCSHVFTPLSKQMKSYMLIDISVVFATTEIWIMVLYINVYYTLNFLIFKRF